MPSATVFDGAAKNGHFCYSGEIGSSTESADKGASKAMETPRIIIIAGPNGAGKTTFARQFLPGEAQCPASTKTPD